MTGTTRKARRRRHTWIAGIVVVLGAACAVESETSVSLVVDADPPVREATRSVEITVLAGERREPRHYQIVPAESIAWPMRLMLRPGLEIDDEFRVAVRAFDRPAAQGALVSSRFVRGEYLQGFDGVMRVALDPGCREVRCDETRDQTCYQGACLSGDLGAPEEQWSADR